MSSDKQAIMKNLKSNKVMTREEQINLYLKERNIPITSLEANPIIEGVEWADEHPKEANGKELLYVCQRTGEIIKKEMIMKACEWISQSYTSGVLDWKNCDSIIEDFRKAMEE